MSTRGRSLTLLPSTEKHPVLPAYVGETIPSANNAFQGDIGWAVDRAPSITSPYPNLALKAYGVNLRCGEAANRVETNS